MTKPDLLKQIAETGYNVGFGAKKHFATYDLVEKAPGWIGFISLGVGVFALFVDVLATKQMSGILIVLGIAGLIINTYGETKLTYAEKGTLLTKLFNDLKMLYYSVKGSEKTDFKIESDALKEIEATYYSNCLSKQIFFSDWYAHYKFFWQHQIEWIDEQKHFKLWRDKIPLSLTFCVSAMVLIGVLYCICFKATT